MFDEYDKALEIQLSKSKEETALQRELRLQLNDGKKAVTALLNMRTLAKTSQQKRELTAEAVRIAQHSVAAYQTKQINRYGWAELRKGLVKQRDIAKARDKIAQE